MTLFKTKDPLGRHRPKEKEHDEAMNSGKNPEDKLPKPSSMHKITYLFLQWWSRVR